MYEGGTVGPYESRHEPPAVAPVPPVTLDSLRSMTWGNRVETQPTSTNFRLQHHRGIHK